MRRKLLVLGVTAAIAYILGARAMRPTAVRRESAAHQAVRLRAERKARDAPKKAAENLVSSSRKAARRAARAARRKRRGLTGRNAWSNRSIEALTRE